MTHMQNANADIRPLRILPQTPKSKFVDETADGISFSNHTQTVHQVATMSAKHRCTLVKRHKLKQNVSFSNHFSL